MYYIAHLKRCYCTLFGCLGEEEIIFSLNNVPEITIVHRHVSMRQGIICYLSTLKTGRGE